MRHIRLFFVERGRSTAAVTPKLWAKGTRLGKFDKKCDEGFLFGYSTTSKAYRVWNFDSGTLEEVHDVEFDETKVSVQKVTNK